VAFRTRTVWVGEEQFHIAELSGLAVEAATEQGNDKRQGYALIALSLCGPHDDRPTYTAETLDQGVAYVMGLPMRISAALTEAVEQLNAADLEDARKKC
tara:strand:- start:5261 stop:5557 length:297 start_codon:yes stop_codon:yes gene_type:complete